MHCRLIPTFRSTLKNLTKKVNLIFYAKLAFKLETSIRFSYSPKHNSCDVITSNGMQYTKVLDYNILDAIMDKMCFKDSLLRT